MADMELDVWQGEWGLPSIDHNCLAVMAYCKFSSVPVKVIKANNPWRSPSGDLPVLRNGVTCNNEGSVTKVSEILNFLRKQNWGTDFDLTLKQSADIIAFTSLMEEKLLPALLHLWWVDSKTYAEFTRPVYAKLLPFPLNYYIPIRKHKETVNRLRHTRGGDNISEVDQESKIYKDGKECLNLLSSKLGDQEYFFGQSPTSLDAIVFGYLAPLLKAPFPNTLLQNHLKGCVNLCQFCLRILSNYFPLDPEEEEAERKRAEEERTKTNQASEFPNRQRNMMVSGMVALTSMVGYAFISGLVQVELTDSDNRAQSTGQPALPNFNQFDKLLDDDQAKQGHQEGKGDGGGQDSQE